MYYSDPTASRAIGAAEKEWKRVARLAYRYRTEPGFAVRIRDPKLLFSGIFTRLLTDPLEDLYEILHPRNGSDAT